MAGDSTVTRSIWFDPQGRLYGLKEVGDLQTSTAISIDTLTGVGTTLFSTGMSWITSMTMAAFPSVGAGAGEPTEEIPKLFALLQNYPNPFNPSTKIGYRVSGPGMVTLKIYDILGREVAVLVNERKGPGSYEVKFDGSGFTSGVYLYRLQAGDFIRTM